MKGKEGLDNTFHWSGNSKEKIMSGDQSFWEFRVNLTNSSGHREGIFKKSLGTFCFKFIETNFFILEMSCVILKWIYIKDKIEEHATENKTICSEWTQLFPFQLNNVFWNNLKHFFIFLREKCHTICFVLLEHMIIYYTFPWVSVVHPYVSLKKICFPCLYDSATELRSDYLWLRCSTSGQYKRNQQTRRVNAMETQFFWTTKNTEFFTRLAILHNIFITI